MLEFKIMERSAHPPMNARTSKYTGLFEAIQKTVVTGASVRLSSDGVNRASLRAALYGWGAKHGLSVSIAFWKQEKFFEIWATTRKATAEKIVQRGSKQK